MGYNELSYLFIFLPLTVLLYSISPKKFRKYVLTAVSWVYFWLCSKYLIVYLLGDTVFIYLMGLWIGKVGDSIPENYEVLIRKAEKSGEKSPEISALKRKKAFHKTLMLVSIIILFGILLYLKYTGFFMSIANRFIVKGGGVPLVAPTLLVPIGLSFYTLEAVGYILEVYWKRIPAEHDFFGIALLIGFFPQTMEGPIARYGDTVRQFTGEQKLFERNGQDMAYAVMRIFWGMFKKIVIADRLNTVVANLFDKAELPHGVMIIVAAVCYTVQLYMEFSGMMDVVIGSARLVGIKLPENFRQPFFSQTASEFWRRWHITLGVFLRTYVFYPVSLSKPVQALTKWTKTHFGKTAARFVTPLTALFCVWICNGLWHGPYWTYILYGMYYFVIIFIELLLENPVKAFNERFHLDENGWGWKLFRFIKLFIIVIIGEMFFLAPDFNTGWQMLVSILTNFHLSSLAENWLNVGMGVHDYVIVIVGYVLIFLWGVLKETGYPLRQRFEKLPVYARWGLLYAVIAAVILFGAYGPGYDAVAMMYAGF